MKSLKLLLLLPSVIYFLSGCAATGSRFSAVEPAPNDMGAVYFYRPNSFVGSAISVAVIDNEQKIMKLQNGQFIKYVAKPGLHKFHTKTSHIDKAVEFDVEAGKNYYVRAGLRQGMWVNTWYLSRVYEDEALEELKSCCKSGK